MMIIQAKNLLRLRHSRAICDGGFTLVELLVSSVVLVVAVTGSIVAFNLITSSVRGTGVRANQNRIIDGDISLINALSEQYGACSNPLGSSDPAGCPDSSPAESFYYFPPNAGNNIATFEAACIDGSIVNNFIASINGANAGSGETNLPDTTGVVNRQSAVRVGTGSNHLVSVSWQDDAGNVIRTIEILPIVSAWCP